MQGDTSFEFTKTAEATHSYPVTRILWEPPSSNKQTQDLLATSGDHLRLWSLPHDQQSYAGNTITRKPVDIPLQKLMPLALLSNSKSPEHTAPITSLDWNVVSPSLIITSSIDTTCTIWDIPSLTAKTQLIAHDKEVFDVRFCAASVDVFVSCGADGSVRMFDLRSLEHSTIIYEPSDKSQDKSGIGPSRLLFCPALSCLPPKAKLTRDPSQQTSPPPPPPRATPPPAPAATATAPSSPPPHFSASPPPHMTPTCSPPSPKTPPSSACSTSGNPAKRSSNCEGTAQTSTPSNGALLTVGCWLVGGMTVVCCYGIWLGARVRRRVPRGRRGAPVRFGSVGLRWGI